MTQRLLSFLAFTILAAFAAFCIAHRVRPAQIQVTRAQYTDVEQNRRYATCPWTPWALPKLHNSIEQA